MIARQTHTADFISRRSLVEVLRQAFAYVVAGHATTDVLRLHSEVVVEEAHDVGGQ